MRDNKNKEYSSLLGRTETISRCCFDSQQGVKHSCSPCHTHFTCPKYFSWKKKLITKGKTYTMKNNKIRIYIYMLALVFTSIFIQLSYRAVVLQHSFCTEQ